jgi:glycosyltransferase involved in cell wall biosynthesis
MAERRPSMLAEWTPRAVDEMVSLLTSERYDVILCRYIHNSFPLFQLPVEIRKRIIIDLDDFYSDANLKMSVSYPGDLSKRFKHIIERYLIASYQKRCLNFGAVLVCSQMDYNILSMNRKIKNIYIIPNSYPIDRFSSKINSDGYENRNVFLFVGTLNYGPNSTGLEWFMESLFPYIQSVNKSSMLLVVGHNPEEKLISRCSGSPGIELHANVPDVGPYYEKCGIVVVPILSGGGTRIKILEAGMSGRPVFSTPFGAYGLDVTDGKDIMIFNDCDSFIERYERMNTKEMYEKIKNNLKITVETKYSTESFDKGMKEVMNIVATKNA